MFVLMRASRIASFEVLATSPVCSEICCRELIPSGVIPEAATDNSPMTTKIAIRIGYGSAREWTWWCPRAQLSHWSSTEPKDKRKGNGGVAGAPEIPSIIADKFSYFFARACSSLTSAIFPTENRVAPPPPSISCASVSGSRAWESMNWQLFTAFLLITTVLILLPRPIVTLVIATSARANACGPGW
jgi:hypothetical protein